MYELLEAMQQRNLVYNYDFRYFSNAQHSVAPVSYGTPDGWVYKDPGQLGSISYSDGYLIIQTSNDSVSTMRFSQGLHEFPRGLALLRGKTVTANVHAVVSDNCKLSLLLSDGVNQHMQTWDRAAAGEVLLTSSLGLDENARKLTLSIESASNAAIIKIAKIYANIGSIALEGLPCVVNGVIGERKQYIATENPPAEELSLNAVAMELTENQTRLDSVLNGRFGVGSNGRSLLPDMRGYFSRAWDNGASTDPDADKRQALGNGSTNTGDHVGTRQDDEFRKHFHSVIFAPGSPAPGGKESPLIPVNSFKNSDTSKVGGRETRSKNIAELYTIKWA